MLRPPHRGEALALPRAPARVAIRSSIGRSSTVRTSRSRPGSEKNEGLFGRKNSGPRLTAQSFCGLRYIGTMRSIDSSPPRKAKGAIIAPVLTPVRQRPVRPPLRRAPDEHRADQQDRRE